MRTPPTLTWLHTPHQRPQQYALTYSRDIQIVVRSPDSAMKTSLCHNGMMQREPRLLRNAP
jgi:hypothetical protein